MTAPTPTKSGTPAMTKISDLLFAHEAPKELGLQVRKSSDREGFDKLKASIAAHGVLMPLMVKTIKGKMYVVAGNRRLKACSDLYGPDAKVPTLNAEAYTGDVREIAMATNVSLPPHPVDRYEVIAELVASGMQPKDVQARFAMDQRAYAQVMKLADLDPVIRDAWREDQIGADVAYAFTLLDKSVQPKVYATEKKIAYQGRINANNIRSKAIGGQANNGRFVQFVGVEAVRAAGITVNEDLFGISHTIDQKFGKKLQALASAKLDAEVKKLLDAGWQWAVTSRPNDFYSYGKIEPAIKSPKPTKEQQARMDEIENSIAVLDEDDDKVSDLEDELDIIRAQVLATGYTPEQRAKAGCLVTISYQGEIEIEYGKVKPAERKKVEAQERKASAKPGDAKPARKEGVVVMTQALAQRLSGTIQEATAEALKKDHKLAAAALIAGFASAGAVVNVRIGNDHSHKPGSFAEILKATAGQSAEELLVMLAQAAGQAVSMTCYSAESMPLKNKDAAALLHALKPDVIEKELRERFDAAGYFSSNATDAIAAAVGEIADADQAARVAKMKKGAAVDYAVALLKNSAWLPPEMRLATYSGPSAQPKAAKPAKAAPAKKQPAKKAAKKAPKKAAKKAKK